MAYYRGDYYVGRGARGDYYRGDPFWGALWTGLKTVGGALLGTLKTGAAAQQQQAQIAGGLSGVQSGAAPWQLGTGGMLEAMKPPPGVSFDRFGPMHRLQPMQPVPSHGQVGGRRR